MDELGVHALDVGQHEQLLNGGVFAHVVFQFRIGVAPLPGGLAEQGHIEQVGFVGVGDGGLRRRDLGRDEVGFHRVGMNAVIELGQGAVEVPGEGKAAVFVVLEPLEFLDQIELELNGDPRGEFKGDVFVGIGAAVTSSLGNQADGMGGVNPAAGGQDKTVESRLFSNPIEFDGIKTGVVQLFPNAKKFDGVPIPQPVLDDVVSPLAVLVSGNIGKADEIVLSLGQDGDGCAPDFNYRFPGLAHGVSVVAGM